MSGFDLEPLRRTACCAVVASSVGGVRQQASVGSAGLDTAFRIASLTKPLTAVAPVLASRRTGAGLGDSDAVTWETARLVVRAGSARPPGRRWEYYNGNYFLAGAVIATLTEATYEDALDDLILRPWGLRSTSFRPPADLVPGVDQGGPVPAVTYPRGRRPSGGLCSTAGDLLTLGEHLLGDPDLLARVRTARTRPDDPMRYGLGWASLPTQVRYRRSRASSARSSTA